ncbi:hypothetical protein [Sporanaerobacter sp. PP17-6a]|uniref:hypothetical protein n=1 Tax=Sporanaerobacter sp. PP17-6a TaxID=1891289 RepID=UPI00358DF39B
MLFDIGHYQLGVRKNLEDFIDFIIGIHIHDNDGENDLHLEVGKGIIEFKEIFSQLYTKLNDLIFVLEYRTIDFEMINSSVKYINVVIPCHR